MLVLMIGLFVIGSRYSFLLHFISLSIGRELKKNPYRCSKKVEKVYLFEMTLSPVGLVCEGGEAQ